MSEPAKCPRCKTDFRYKGADGKEYLKVIGIYSRELDRTVSWKCPECEHEWERR